jgi:DNA polymerase
MPCVDDDGAVRPFGGAAAKLLTDIIVKGMRLRREAVYVCTLVQCGPEAGGGVTKDELKACAPRFRKQIEAMKPKAIVVLGETAAQALLETDERIAELRGNWRSYLGIPVMPTLHPAHLVDHPEDKKLAWSDIQKVMAKLGIALPEKK